MPSIPRKINSYCNRFPWVCGRFDLKRAEIDAAGGGDFMDHALYPDEDRHDGAVFRRCRYTGKPLGVGRIDNCCCDRR